MKKFEMSGSESPQPKKSEEAQVPSGGDINIPIPNYNIAASQFITLPDGSLMTKEAADRYYGTLGRPLEQREIMPRKVGVTDQPFSANEAVVMSAATANAIANRVELEIKTGKNKESASGLINPVIEKRGIKVMKKLMDKLGSDATPEQVRAASVTYVEDLEKMFAEERIDPVNRRYFEGELLAAKSAKRRLSDVVDQIESSGKYQRSLSEDYDLLISQHNDYLKQASASSAELETLRAQSRITTQAHSTETNSSETTLPAKREFPMNDDEIARAKALVLGLNRTTLGKESPISNTLEEQREMLFMEVLSAAKSQTRIHTDIPSRNSLHYSEGMFEPRSGFGSFGDGVHPEDGNFYSNKLQDRTSVEAFLLEEDMKEIYKTIIEVTKKKGLFRSKDETVERQVLQGKEPNMITNPVTGEQEPAVKVAYQFDSNPNPDLRGPLYRTTSGRPGNVLFVEVTLPKSIAENLRQEILSDPKVARRFAKTLALKSGITDESWDRVVCPPYDQLPSGWNLAVANLRAEKESMHVVISKQNIDVK